MKRGLMALGLATLLCGFGCDREKHHHGGEGPAKFLVTSALRKDVSITREYVCQIHAIQHIELRALERGYLQGIFVDEGQLVKAGQRMFQIMPLVYQAERGKARAEAEFAKIEYLNTKALTDRDVVSPNELALSRAKYEKAQAELALAEVHLKLTEIKAPFEGIMHRFRVRLGSLVEEGELLTTLSDNSAMWVYFNVTEAEYLDYKSRAKSDEPLMVKLMMANGRLFDQDGKVETIEAEFNNETGTIAFRATFPNPKRLLRHGETGKVLVSAPLKGALIIPQKATFEILDQKQVFAVDDQNVVRLRRITVAEELPHLYVVESGLAEGEKILLEGLRKVRDGDRILQDYKEPDEVIAHLELPAE